VNHFRKSSGAKKIKPGRRNAKLLEDGMSMMASYLKTPVKWLLPARTVICLVYCLSKNRSFRKLLKKNVRMSYWPFFLKIVSLHCMHRGESIAGLY